MRRLDLRFEHRRDLVRRVGNALGDRDERPPPAAVAHTVAEIECIDRMPRLRGRAISAPAVEFDQF